MIWPRYALLLQTLLVHFLDKDIDIGTHAHQVVPEELVLCFQELLFLELSWNLVKLVWRLHVLDFVLRVSDRVFDELERVSRDIWVVEVQ